MSSGNRLQRRRLSGDHDDYTLMDYQDTANEDTLYDTIKIGLIAATGYGLYKTGAIKELMRPLLEVADSIAANSTDKASAVMSTVKKWSNLKILSPEQLARSKTQNYSGIKDSIFRERDSSIFYDLVHDTLEYSPDRLANFQRVRKVMQASREDLGVLAKMIDGSIKGLPKKRKDYTNTELFYRMRELNVFEGMTSRYSGKDEIPLNLKAFDSILEKLTLTKEQAAQELKESGYRKLTAGDIMDLVKDAEGNYHFEANGRGGIMFSDRSNTYYVDMVKKFEDFLREPSHRYMDGDKYVSAIKTGRWKDIIIDPHMRIDNNGKIIDYRMTMDSFVAFRKSLANDFKLPVVQFNPFKSIGFDKSSRLKPILGLEAANQIDPNITLKAGRYSIGEYLSDTFGEDFADKTVGIINGDAFIVGKDRKLIKLRENLRVHDITFADGPFSLKPTLNATRVMAGLDLGSPIKTSIEEYERLLGRELTTKEKILYQAAKAGDFGFMEGRPHGMRDNERLDTATSFDEITDNFINNLTKKIRVNGFEYDSVDEMLALGDGTFGSGVRRFTLKDVWGEGFEEVTEGDKIFKPKMYTTTKEGYKLKDAFQQYLNGDSEAASDTISGFYKQFMHGGQDRSGNMSEFTTERTGAFWILFNQLSEGLNASSYLLGLSTESKRNPRQFLKNLLVKRALPVYIATQVPGIINYLSEPFFGGETDETGNRDNLGKYLMRGVRTIDVGAHHAMDLVGATKLFKFLGDMVPGTDQVTELLPLGLGQAQTAEEREEWIENGYDPIRKGRYWGSGNTPLSGGKIMYFRPNFYRRVEADVDFSDSKWGSRQEYYNNTWYPNPVNPLAPVNYFFTNRNHYDYKHYYDRPYLQTSPVGQNIPLVGPLFSSTIGRIISPPQKMHEEYWDAGLQVNPADEQASTLLTEGKLYTSYKGNEGDIHVFQEMNQRQAEINQLYQQQLSTAQYQAKEVTKTKITDASGITFTQRTVLPYRDYDRYNTPYEAYSTPSGAINVVDVPDELNLYNVSQDLQRYSLNRVIGTNQRVNVTDIGGPGIPVGNDSLDIDNSFIYGLGEQYNWAGDIAGLKGFGLQQFVTGHANEHAMVIEDSGYAYSFNNDFWEENLGGLGGNLSEITRRFVPQRNKNTEYINPVRNTMPSWMPGSSYFTDFKHGDPYSKIDNGEERLPGEGYERLNNIHGLLELNIGSSSIGYDKSYIIRHMLKQDSKYMSGFEEDTLNKGTQLHKQIEQAWVDVGLAFSTEGEIKDTRNGIIGYYDAMVHDQSSPTGIGIVDIKTTSAKKLEEIKRTHQPLDHHQRQVNYYLWATQNEASNGYIHYVDKENPDNNYTVGFKYSQEMLEDTLNNVYEARKEIREGVANGTIGRGELYDIVDQYRILADVAPYSQEFKDVQAQISSADLTDEEREEVAGIRERMQEMKEPLRVYPYRFKTANLKTETVTVARIVDNNTIVTKEYGKEHSVKFAGIRVSENNSERFNPEDDNDKRTKNEAAQDELRKYVRKGSRITISYDANERNKFSKDSTESIRAVVYSHGKNVNQRLLNAGHATEKEDDDSPAAIHARYSKGEIAFGAAMERMTHAIADVPFIGNKFYQVRSPYEQYRDREVYGKDFQSWNNPISGILIPHIDKNIANNSFGGIGGIVMGAFIGSMFGKKGFGKLVGATVGGAIPAIGKIAFIAGTDKDRDWRPKRRRDQEELNEYVDTLKYVKYTRLYNQYKDKAKHEDNFDVDSFIGSKEYAGAENSRRQRELDDFKRKVKLDFKHRDRYNFKYGEPKYVDMKADKKTIISQINKELSELQSQRKVTKLPENALKAIEYKQMADQTMYGYEPGDSLVNIMTALPKKERQYFKHFMDAPEEEKQKILQIAPSYLRRALQSTWGMTVDQKPTLQEYFQQHALPDADWIGWDESTNMDDVKVKLVHQNKMDPGEFDVWDDNEVQADQTNIPIPDLNRGMSARMVQLRLQQVMGQAGYNNTQVSFMNSSTGNRTTLISRKDARPEVSRQIDDLDV